ncbi:hypothetical protein DAPPUDRAFT_259911 [Daphnia pulex]|uniref:Uncharacterized protein n=1 Tax=Daphnia pulex TaxID=6669 RepID=E9HI44_DAPPU|nr:hypothetical protein DAPPUDRAFT_259911 [Daphnia pulex]|eukprot:EFX68592.1 hypothetical protein DAPPUDRAFT_259911 [Daphnia pulex]
MLMDHIGLTYRRIQQEDSRFHVKQSELKMATERDSLIPSMLDYKPSSYNSRNSDVQVNKGGGNGIGQPLARPFKSLPLNVRILWSGRLTRTQMTPPFVIMLIDLASV